MILTIWFVLIALEVWRNYYVIAIKRRSPNHSVSAVFRCVVGLIFWILSPFFAPGLEIDQWLAEPFMMAFTFWWTFDTALNVALNTKPYLKRPFWYLGKTTIDQWQKDHGGAWPWFWWKLFLAAGSIALFVYGWNYALSAWW